MTECVESSNTPSQRYPYVRREGRRWQESHWVWMQANGPVPEGMMILHSCDNTRCVLLEHLFPGTPQNNMDDMVAKRRGFEQQKTHCPKGHPYVRGNGTKSNARRCRECPTEIKRRVNEKKLALAIESGEAGVMTCYCGCAGVTAYGRKFLAGHDAKAVHTRIRARWGSVAEFVRWFDENPEG